jgi:hypothetical protein
MLRAAAALLAFALLPIAALGAGIAFLNGTVTTSGKPVANVTVTVSGNNTTQQTKTGPDGTFSFGNLAPGQYSVQAASPQGEATQHVDLGAAGSTLALELVPKQIGKVVVARNAVVRSAGTDVTVNQQQIARSAAGPSLTNQLVQLPGAARGANGVVHINGDHGDINYIIDGVSLPQELNRIVGTEFDPNDIAFMEVIEGAYPAQYGERFAAVLNIGTTAGAGPAGASATLSGGSYNHYFSTLGYHTPLGKGSFVVSSHNERSSRFLDPPNFDSPHDNGSDTNQFLRYTLPMGNDFLNVIASHSYQTFQIPNDVAGGQPAQTDDNETQEDTFTAVQYRHAIGSRGSLSFGPAYKQSTIRDFGDPANDFIYGMALNPGAPTDCANALGPGGAPNPAVNYTIGTCGFSLFSNRTARDYKFNVDYALRSKAHEIRYGAVYDMTNVTKNYAISLQPGNFLAPLLTPGTPGAAYTVVDNAPNVGHTQEAYLQDSWRMGSTYELDYGVRFDAFQLFSTQFGTGYSQFSPRVKFTRFFGPRASLYVYYGRFFTPFSFENVSPSAAFLLNLPLQLAPAAFDLKPQRDSDYEIGGHLPIGDGDLGLRVMQKNATDLIDDTQVGVTNLHQDINFNQGRIATQSLYYQVPLPRGGRTYLSVNHTYSVNKGCETQLLAPCFGSPTDWTPADHQQRWGATSGVLLNDRRGGWFAMDGEYGSGLSSSACPVGTPGFCSYTPHVTFDVVKGIALTPGAVLTLRLGNILNDRYLVTFMNAQGNHYVGGRTYDLGIRFGASGAGP